MLGGLSKASTGVKVFINGCSTAGLHALFAKCSVIRSKTSNETDLQGIGKSGQKEGFHETDKASIHT